MKVTFPAPTPGTWPPDAEFRDLWEGRVGVVLHDHVLDARLGECLMIREVGTGEVELFKSNELTRVCPECGHVILDLSTMRCTWSYCPTLP